MVDGIEEFIDNVQFLKTNSGKKGEGMPVVRNSQFYFREGFCWNLINGTRSSNDLKFRISPVGVNDVGAMTLHINENKLLSNNLILSICNSPLISKYTEAYVNFSVNFQVNDCRQIPIIIPSTEQLNYINKLVDKAIEIKESALNISYRADLKNQNISIIEEQIFEYINKLYRI